MTERYKQIRILNGDGSGPELRRDHAAVFLLFNCEEDVEKWTKGKASATGILQRSDNKQWGYWEYDPKAREKYWVEVDIPDWVEDLHLPDDGMGDFNWWLLEPGFP